MAFERRSYGIKLSTKPNSYPVSTDSARRNSRLDTTDDDERLNEAIQAATGYVQQHSDTALITSTWQWTFDRFPLNSQPLSIPIWPVQSITSITYKDETGTQQTIDSNKIVLRSHHTGRARVALADWESWPATRSTPDAVTITFVAGYGDSPNDVPSEWKQAILMLVSHWMESREATIGTMSKEVEFGVSALIETLRDPDDGVDFDLADDSERFRYGARW